MSRALVIAANNFDRQRYKGILTDLDLEVHDQPRNGVEALHAFRLLKPQLVVLDLIFPGMSGLELVRTMKNDYDEASIIFLTPVNSRSLLERAFRLRADDILVKPFSDEEFASAVLHLIEKNASQNRVTAASD